MRTGNSQWLSGERSTAPLLFAPQRVPFCRDELKRHISAIAETLGTAGFGANDVAALALPNGPELLTAFLAVSSIGACAPLDPALTEPEFGVHLEQLGARILLVQDEESPAARAARKLGMQVATVLHGTEDPAGKFSLKWVVERSAAGTCRKTDAALLLFTSATTGTPKLVPLTWANLDAMAAHERSALKISHSDRLLSLMPLFHLHGLAAALTQLFCGGAVVSMPGFEPASFVAALQEFEPTWFTSNPSLNRALLRLTREQPEMFRTSHLRFIRSTAAAAEPALASELEHALSVPLLDGYGMTETGGVTRSTADARKAHSVGRSSGLELAIFDLVGTQLPPGAEGEIAVRGPSVMHGYLDAPEANATVFQNGWFRTGDLGRLDDEGFLYIIGRLKEVIHRGGEKVVPQEIETVLLAHEAIADAAVFSISHPTLGNDVAAAVVLRNDQTVTEVALRAFVAQHVARFKVPRTVMFVDDFPRTATGKVKRAELAKAAECLVPPKSEEPEVRAGSVEEKILNVWRHVLNVETLGLDDDFFARGGDSLSATEMLSAVQQACHATRLTTAIDFFEQPTVRSLARMICNYASPEEATTCFVPFQTEGSGTPVFLFPASGLHPQYFKGLSRSLGPDQPVYGMTYNSVSGGEAPASIQTFAARAAADIRRLRPKGQYILAGHCFGGVVAFEVARRLTECGCTVALVLFDVGTPGYPKVRWQHYVRYAYRAVLRNGQRKLTVRAVREHFSTLTRNRTSRKGLPVAIEAQSLTRTQRKQLDGTAMRSYEPQVLAVPILHFIAGDRDVASEVLEDSRLGWRHFTTNGITICNVEGTHDSMFNAAQTDSIAARIRDLFDPRLKSTTAFSASNAS